MDPAEAYEKGRKLAREHREDVLRALEETDGNERLRLLQELGSRVGFGALHGTSYDAAKMFQGIQDELDGKPDS